MPQIVISVNLQSTSIKSDICNFKIRGFSAKTTDLLGRVNFLEIEDTLFQVYFVKIDHYNAT